MDRSQTIHRQYEQWPYPNVPIIGSVRRIDTWQINLDYLTDRCGVPPPPPRPRILIAGCGTFQPYVFGLANPQADILAVDISEKSLAIARRRTLLHGMGHIKYQTIDLNQPSTYPEGPFDYIECYGVLMNLTSPEQALKELTSRLSDQGILRLMVYPYYSRQRIFQIQRLARLLGLSSQNRSHPGLLRKIIHALPPDHPLYYAFTTYLDSRNDAGVVDGFLHAGDCGFTGYQLGELIARAGCRPSFYFHRPWGHPELMGNRLGFTGGAAATGQNQSFVLNYLDLWQELRTNWIVCLTKDNRVERPAEPIVRPHPLLIGCEGPMSHRLRLQIYRWTGLTLPTRTEANPIRLSGATLRALSRLPSGSVSIEALFRKGILLGGPHRPIALAAHQSWPGERPLREEAPFLVSSIEIGDQVANPLYDPIFKAYTFAQEGPYATTLSAEIERWRTIADPLEDAGQFGLTPFGTYLCFPNEMKDFMKKRRETVSDFSQVRYQGEDAGLDSVRSFLKQFPLPKKEWSDAVLRELWILLLSYRSLFLNANKS
jgi:hypothetical protein